MQYVSRLAPNSHLPFFNICAVVMAEDDEDEYEYEDIFECMLECA